MLKKVSRSDQRAILIIMMITMMVIIIYLWKRDPTE